MKTDNNRYVSVLFFIPDDNSSYEIMVSYLQLKPLQTMDSAGCYAHLINTA